MLLVTNELLVVAVSSVTRHFRFVDSMNIRPTGKCFALCCLPFVLFFPADNLSRVKLDFFRKFGGLWGFSYRRKQEGNVCRACVTSGKMADKCCFLLKFSTVFQGFLGFCGYISAFCFTSVICLFLGSFAGSCFCLRKVYSPKGMPRNRQWIIISGMDRLLPVQFSEIRGCLCFGA